MTPQEEFAELYEVKRMIESKLFQQYIAEPLRKKQDKLHLNFFSDSLKDAWRKGGNYEGIECFFEILKEVNNDLKNKKTEIG